MILSGCTPDTFGAGGASAGGDSGRTSGEVSTSADGTSMVVGTAVAEGTAEGSGAETIGADTSGSAQETDGASDSSDGASSSGGAAPPPCVPQAELVACYDFLDVGAGTLLDLSGNGNDAPAPGIGVVPGPFGDAATFGPDAEIAVADSASLDVPSTITSEAWLLIDALPTSGRMGVIDNDGQYSITIQASDEYRCSASGVALQHGPVVVGSWSHVACVADGSALRLFVNGIEAASVPHPGTLNTGNGNPMSVGDTSPGFGEPLQGAMGGLRIWSIARSPEQLCEAAAELCGG